MEIIKGDLINLAKEGRFNAIAHGCNLQHNFGAGIAKQIAINFPIAEQVDKETYEPKLGEISVAFDIKHNLNIINCYTQIWYGKPYKRNSRNFIKEDTSKARYNAIRECMKKINREFSGLHIGLPLIGAGLAGLNWNTIQIYIEDELTDMDVTIVKYKK